MFLFIIDFDMHAAAFLTWIGGLLLGVFLLHRGRKSGNELIRDIGIAMFIGGFLGLSINQLEFRESKKLLRDLRTDIVTTHFGRNIPPDVSKQVEDNIVLDPFYYVNFDVEYTLTRLPDSPGTEDILRADIDQRYVVRNITQHDQEFPLVTRTSDPNSPMSPGLSRVSVTSKRDPSKNMDLNAEQIQAGMAPTSGNALRFSRTFKMAPGEELDVHLRKYAFPATRDLVLQTVRHPSGGLRLRINFPDAGYTKSCSFNHSGGDSECTYDDNEDYLKAEINVAVLPHQGIMVEWAKIPTP